MARVVTNRVVDIWRYQIRNYLLTRGSSPSLEALSSEIEYQEILEFSALGLKIRWEQSSIGEGLAEKAFEAQNLTAINRARPL